ncbi:MAG: NUDIX domain-containing protein [Chlamydiia bacterium]|nr:NUDIX domain-containing protein [Chlamydiia bacterium]
MRIEEDESFGIIPLQERDGIWNVLLIQHRAGHWAFPKGHLDEGEGPIEAAVRELKEETSLDIEYFVDAPPKAESYSFYHRGSRINKTVTYFPAVVQGALVFQPEEIADGRWVPLLEAGNYVSFAQARSICDELMKEMTPERLQHRLAEPRLN